MERTCTLCKVTANSEYKWESHISTDEHRIRELVYCVNRLEGMLNADTTLTRAWKEEIDDLFNALPLAQKSIETLFGH